MPGITFDSPVSSSNKYVNLNEKLNNTLERVVTVDHFRPAESRAKKNNILRKNSSIVVACATNNHKLILHRKSRGKIHMFWTEELA